MSAERLAGEAPAVLPPRHGRSGSNNRQRKRGITIRLSPAEKEQVANVAKSRGLPAATLLRETLLGVSAPPARRTSLNDQAIGRLLAEVGALKGELGKAGSNLNQIAKNLNAGRDALQERTALAIEAAVEETRTAQKRITEIWQELMHLAGRSAGSS